MRSKFKVEENTLIIQGERKFIKESPDTSYLQIQRPFGTFQRTFALPRGIDQEISRPVTKMVCSASPFQEGRSPSETDYR